MKINLTQIKVRPSLLEEEKVLDVQKTIADLIWKECGKDDIAKASFALRLFDAPGEIEITDVEKQYIENWFAWIVRLNYVRRKIWNKTSHWNSIWRF